MTADGGAETKTSERSWDLRMMAVATVVASWSKDPHGQVGALVVSPDRRRVSWGYNGFPRGVADTVKRLQIKPLRDELTMHAELNAILQAPDCRGWTMYSTKFPCLDCAKAIVQRGVALVVSPPFYERGITWGESQTKAVQMLREAGVCVRLLT